MDDISYVDDHLDSAFCGFSLFLFFPFLSYARSYASPTFKKQA
jgi:hypothetical protein